MAKYNPFDPANGYSEEDRLALNGKCASLIKSSTKPLIDTGALRQNCQYVITKGKK